MSGKKVANLATKATVKIDWDRMAKMVVFEARKEFFNLCRTFKGRRLPQERLLGPAEPLGDVVGMKPTSWRRLGWRRMHGRGVAGPKPTGVVAGSAASRQWLWWGEESE